jgi:cobalt-zinc-cadmium efflux system protein
MGAHHHGDHNSSSTKVLSIAIVLTFGFALIEAVGGFYAHSLALISDAGHMATDSVSLIIALIGAHIASRPPSPKHSYGLGRAEVITALVSCVSMLVLSILIVVEAFERIGTPPTHIMPLPIIIIASVGLLLNILIAFMLSRGHKTLNIRAALLHVFGDILGSIAALASGVVIYFAHWASIDAILSLFIAILIGLSSIRMLKEALHILMEGVPHHLNINKIKQSITATEGVLKVYDLHVWSLNSQKVALSAHIQIKSLNLWDNIYYTVSRLCEKEFAIGHVTLQPELTPESCKHCDD